MIAALSTYSGKVRESTKKSILITDRKLGRDDQGLLEGPFAVICVWDPVISRANSCFDNIGDDELILPRDRNDHQHWLYI